MTFGEIEKEWAGLDDRERESERESYLSGEKERERETVFQETSTKHDIIDLRQI